MVLTNEYILNRIQGKFGEQVLSHEEPFGLLTLVVDKNINLELIQFLKTDAELQVNFMTDLCGIHYPDNKGAEIGVVYHLHSLTNNFRIRIKCFMPTELASIRSAVNLFPAANWMERETFDFYGINFEGHPNLIRILNVEDMNYFPMLKQYPLEDGTREDKNDTYFGR